MSRRVCMLILIGLWAATIRATEVGWDVLAGFDFEAPAYEAGQSDDDIVTQSRAQIPQDIAALHDQPVVLTGFMLPVRMDGSGKVTEFLLVSDPMVCCYGAVPRVNEWVTVKLAKPAEALMDVPLKFAGRLQVGPVLDNGYLTTIYELLAAAPAGD